MKITIESTGTLTEIDGVPARLWKGVTESGVECFVFVHRLAAARTQDLDQFVTELFEQLPPGVHIELRDIL